MSIDRFKDYSRELSLVTRRAIVTGVVLALLTGGLGARMYYLQIMTHEEHAARSASNRISLQPIPPNRGLIYDREGRLLAENLPNHRLSLVLERVDNLDATLEELQSLVDLTEEDLERFHRTRQRARRPFSPVPLKDGLSEEEIARLAANRYYLEGVEVEANLVRHYPYEDLFSHALGYVGRINLQERRRLDESRYVGTEYVGKSGIERFYENELVGNPGSQTVEINARGQILQVLDRDPPEHGTDLQLHLDVELQRAAFEALEGKRGSAVAIDVKTGGILAMVSRPSFDPNLFVEGFSSGEYAALASDIDLPFLNRAARGQYAPASTIKPFLAIAGLRAGSMNWDDRVEDPGYFELPNDSERRYYDWTWRIRPEGRGARIGMKQAIEESSNTYFYHLAYETRLEAIHDTLAMFGFGRNMVADLHNPAVGINPSRDWKRQRHGQSWYAGDTVNLGVGQGYLLVTPMQVAVAASVLARDGDWIRPRFLKDSTPANLVETLADDPADIERPGASDWDRLSEAMLGVVHGDRGTARSLSVGIDYKIAGKTGTAQVFSIENFEEHDSDEVAERLRDHAWFMGYAPQDDPQIAVAVLVENGESGGRAAGPIARRLFDVYLREPALAQSGADPWP